MMYALQNPLIGASQIQYIGQGPDATPTFTNGATVDAVDNYFGPGRFIYMQANAAISKFSLCTILPALSGAAPFQYVIQAGPVANTANLGLPACVAMQAMTTGQWGWFATSGTVPVWCSASLAAGSKVGIVAAGQGGTLTGGKMVEGAVVVAPATTTVVKANSQSVVGNLGQVLLQNTDGLFSGVAVSGTGITGGTLVSSFQSDMRTIGLSANATAAVAGSLTFTYNDATNFYNLVYLGDGLSYQGPIT